MKNCRANAHTIYPASSHVEPKGGRYDSIAPMAYSVLWRQPDGTLRRFYGFGGERSPLVMLAHGIMRGIEEILLENDPESVSVACVTETLDFWETPDTWLFRWYRDKQASRDALGTWTDLAAYKELGQLITRTPSDTLDRKFIGDAKQHAKILRSDVLADFKLYPERYRTPGMKFQNVECKGAA